MPSLTLTEYAPVTAAAITAALEHAEFVCDAVSMADERAGNHDLPIPTPGEYVAWFMDEAALQISGADSELRQPAQDTPYMVTAMRYAAALLEQAALLIEAGAVPSPIPNNQRDNHGCAEPLDGYGWWDEYPDYPRSDWQDEISNGDTGQGYWSWVRSRLNMQ